jgi:hypothetical protein
MSTSRRLAVVVVAEKSFEVTYRRSSVTCGPPDSMRYE